MKKLVTAFVLAALAATPAFAKTYRAQASNAYLDSTRGSGAFASVGVTGYGANSVYSDSSIATASPNSVVFNGSIIGADPDPNIRFQLWREAPFLEGGPE